MIGKRMRTRLRPKERSCQKSSADYFVTYCGTLLAFLMMLSPVRVHSEEESLEGQIDLMYASDMRLKELSGQTWETIGDRRSYFNYFTSRESKAYFKQWRQYERRPTVRFRQLSADHKDTVMIEFKNNPDRVGTQVVALRLLAENGLQYEFRRLNEQQEDETETILKKPKSEYRRVRVQRSKKSSALEDIVTFEVRHLTDDELEREHGIRWGQPIRELAISTFMKSFHFKSVREVFEDSGWQLPQWEGYWRLAESSGRQNAADDFLEIPLAGSEDLRHYFYLDTTSDEVSLRIVAVHPIHGLIRFHEYEAGNYRITSRAGAQIRYRKRSPYDQIEKNIRATQSVFTEEDVAYSMPRLGLTSPSRQFAKIDLRNYVLYNTKDFLAGPGKMFSQWASLRESRYDLYTRKDRYATSVRALKRHSGYYEFKGDMPIFCFVEFSENSVRRVVTYNELLVETDYRIPTWWMQHGSRVRWSLITILSLVCMSFLAARLAGEHRRKREEERRDDEREKSERTKKLLEYTGKRVDYFIRNENFDDAESVIEHLKTNSPKEAGEVVRLQLQNVRKARVLSAKRAIDRNYEEILAVVENQGLPALQQLEAHLENLIRDVDEEVASKTKELKELCLSKLQAKQLQDDESKEKEIQEDIKAAKKVRLHLKEKLKEAKQLLDDKDRFVLFVNFLAGNLASSEQKAIEILAAARNIKIDSIRSDFSLFASLMSQDEERKRIATSVVGEQIELKERAQRLEQEVSRLRASRASQEKERKKLERDLRVGRQNEGKLRRVEAALQKTEDELAQRTAEIEGLRERIRWLEDEERKVAELREQKRTRLLQAIRGCVYAEDSRRGEFKSKRLCFDHEYGFIIAEAHRALQAQIKDGRWVDAIDTPEYVMSVVEGFLRKEDYEERFLHSDGKRVIRDLNRYLAGKTPLSDARNSALCLTHHRWALERVREGSSHYLLESWLEPHRQQQTKEYQLFKSGEHDRQAELKRDLQTIGLTSPTLEQWIGTWDEQPWLFIKY